MKDKLAGRAQAGPRSSEREPRFSISRRGPFWRVLVQDAPKCGRVSVPCFHTAGVYYSEPEALALLSELEGSGR
jgi:hypothetical protein